MTPKARLKDTEHRFLGNFMKAAASAKVRRSCDLKCGYDCLRGVLTTLMQVAEPCADIAVRSATASLSVGEHASTLGALHLATLLRPNGRLLKDELGQLRLQLPEQDSSAVVRLLTERLGRLLE